MATKAPETQQESVVKSVVVPIIVLVAICVVCSALLAGLNSVTKPIIDANTLAETQAAYLGVMPVGTDAASLTELDGLTTAGVEGGVRSGEGTVALKAAAAGYGGKNVTVYVAFDAAGTISNLTVDASNQTTGIGSKVAEDSFASGFIGWDAASAVALGAPVDAIAGATVSSRAVVNALNAAIDCYNNEIAGVA